VNDAPVRRMLVELPFRVSTYDVDFVGIVHNAVYIRWLEDLRNKLLDEYFPLKAALERGIAPVLSRTEIDYRWPVRMFDRVVGRMWVPETKRAQWVVAAEIVTEDRVAATARQTGYFVEIESKRPIPLPEELKGQL